MVRTMLSQNCLHVFIFCFRKRLLLNLSRKSQNQLWKLKLQSFIINRHLHIIPPVELFQMVKKHIYRLQKLKAKETYEVVRPFSIHFSRIHRTFLQLNSVHLTPYYQRWILSPNTIDFFKSEIFFCCTTTWSFVTRKTFHLTWLFLKKRFIWFHGVTDVESK